MKKLMKDRNRVDKKRYDTHDYCHTACQQKNLFGFLEMSKLTFEANAMAKDNE